MRAPRTTLPFLLLALALLPAAYGVATAASLPPERVWVSRYNGPGNNADDARKIAVDGAGNVYVTGTSYNASGANGDYATVKYDAAGNQVWVQRYNGPPGSSTDEALALAVDGNGNVYVTGYSTGSGTSFDYATVKYDTGGTEQWVRRYNGADFPQALAVGADGNVYVTGDSQGPQQPERGGPGKPEHGGAHHYG